MVYFILNTKLLLFLIFSLSKFVPKSFFFYRLKKEMVMRVNQVAAEFRKVSNKQMAETTKRTIRENVSINAQLAKMSDKTMEMIQDNDDLKLREKKQRQQVEMLEANEKELAKKNHSNQKVRCSSAWGILLKISWK